MKQAVHDFMEGKFRVRDRIEFIGTDLGVKLVEPESKVDVLGFC